MRIFTLNRWRQLRSGVDESLVKSASQGVSAGCGVRVVSGERTGYAYTDDLSAERLLHAARTAALIASGPAKQIMQGFTEAKKPDLYPIPCGGCGLDLAARLKLVMRADRAARAFDSRIVQVRASYGEEMRRILIAASDGTFASDMQPLARFNVFVIAKDGERSSRGTSGGGGRVEIDFFEGLKSPEHFATEAARQAILQLECGGGSGGRDGSSAGSGLAGRAAA